MAFVIDPVQVADFLRRNEEGLRAAQDRYERELHELHSRAAATPTAANKTQA
jgi:hypothetical protein